MGNIKHASFSLLITPILFIGCTSEKITQIKPKTPTQITIQTENNKTISKEERLLASAIFGGIISLEENSSIEQSQNSSILLSEKQIEQTLTGEEHPHWQPFTKEDEILETAKQFLGVKYLWAANGPSAFDCSGFTRYVFKKSGIFLPRHSGKQATIGKKINRLEDLKKGDLVFFDTDKKFKRIVNHVGIFIGNNQFIHASSAKKKVIITSFDKKKFYKNKFLYARRILNNQQSFVVNNNTLKNNSLTLN